jgi:spore maturation protein CgeB
MRVVIVWPSHTNSTFNTAYFYNRAFKRLHVQTANFVYSQELITQNLGINAFRGTVDEAYVGDSILITNRLLMGYIASALPDAIIIVTGLDLYKSAWKWIQEFRGALKHPYKIITIFTESPYRPSEEPFVASMSDYVFTNEKSYVGTLRKFQPRSWYLPQAYDEKMHVPDDKEHKYGVYMCGSGFLSRVEVLSRVNWEETGTSLMLKGLFPDIKKDTALFPFYQEGLVPNEKVVEDYQASDICLNIHRQEGDLVIFERDLPKSYNIERRQFKVTNAYSMNNRASEIAAAGGFQLVDDTRQEVEDVFGNSVPRFSINEPGELQEMIAYYTRNPRQRAKLAEESRMRIEGRTYLANTKKILNLTGG